jgi:hypothetical protein
MEIALLTAFIALAISIFTAIYSLGYKFGKIDAKMEFLTENFKWIRNDIFTPLVQEQLRRGSLRMRSSDYEITKKGEENIPDDVKREIINIVKSRKFRKLAKIDKSIEGIAPLIANRIRTEKLKEIAEANDTDIRGASIIAAAYAKKYILT